MSNHFSSLFRVALDFFRRPPQDNPMAKYEIPAFLRPPYLPAEPGQGYGGYPFTGAIKFICKNGDVWVFPDGRVIDLRTNTSPSIPRSDACDQAALAPCQVTDGLTTLPAFC